MFFITKDGVKDWKEGDSWYKPASVEGYEASTPSTGMSMGLKVIIGIFVAFALFGLIAFLVNKSKQKRTDN